MENEIQIIPLELEDIIGVEDVARELDISPEEAVYAMKLGLIPSIVKRGRITLRPVLEKYKQRKMQRQN